MTSKRGFTLIEMLVVVLIIAILVVMVFPWLHRAILRSKYSMLMLPGKSIWEGQEAFYLLNSRYATDISDLDITVPARGEIIFDVHADQDYAYVKTSRSGFHNNYVMYQKFSRNFPGQTHCEALNDNNYAQWICAEVMHGSPIEGSSTESDYTAYVIGQGGQNGD